MKFRGRFDIGMRLVDDSVHVLRRYPSLLVFPLVSGAGALLVFWTFVAGPFAPTQRGPAGFVMWTFGFYFAVTLVTAIANAALMHNARQVFLGETPSVRAGIGAALRHVHTLAIYAFFTAFVLTIVRILERGDSGGGDVAATAVSIGWALATYFVVPVIVFEDRGAWGMIGRSKSIFVSTWGETIGNTFGIEMLWLGLAIGGCIFVGLFVLALDAVIGHVPGVYLLFGLTIATAYVVGTALAAIAKTALYVYATEDEHPEPFRDVDFSIPSTSVV